MIKQDLFRYVILPGKPGPGSQNQELHDRAYEFWKSFWSKIYSDAGSPESFVPEDFTRQDFIPVILHGDTIVAMHLYTIFNIRSLAIREHRYFKFFPEEFFSYLWDHSVDSVLSLEFLTVAEGWRKHDIGVSLSRVLVDCSRRLMNQLPVGALIGPARSDNKVNEMVVDFGFTTFQAGLKKRNFTVDLMVGFRNQIHPCSDFASHALAKELWNKRQDLTLQNSELTSELAA